MAGCKCIPGNMFSVTNITSAASSPISSMIRPYLDIIASNLCQWAQPEYGDMGESWEKALWKAALVAIATINTAAQISIMDKRYSIAKDYANLASDKWNRFKDGYAPLERAVMTEAGNAPVYTENYSDAVKRGDEAVTSAYNSIADMLADKSKQYALCVDETLIDALDLNKAQILIDSINFNYRDEEFFALYKSDQRWNRRSEMLNLGRDIHQTSASYAGAANTALAGLGDTLNQGAAGAMKLLGYMSTAQETQYPATFTGMSPMMGQASQLGTALTVGPAATCGV